MPATADEVGVVLGASAVTVLVGVVSSVASPGGTVGVTTSTTGVAAEISAVNSSLEALAFTVPPIPTADIMRQPITRKKTDLGRCFIRCSVEDFQNSHA